MAQWIKTLAPQAWGRDLHPQDLHKERTSPQSCPLTYTYTCRPCCTQKNRFGRIGGIGSILSSFSYTMDSELNDSLVRF